MPLSDDETPPSGPIADFAAELHSRAQALTFDLPFALQPETPPARDEQQGILDFKETH